MKEILTQLGEQLRLVRDRNGSEINFHFLFPFFFFQCEILGSQPGIEPAFLQWKRGVLTTGPPEKSPFCFSSEK